MTILSLLFLSFFSVISAKSNPQGYLVNEVYQYSGCAGVVTAKFSLAVGICVNSGLMGSPWINQYMIYSMQSDGNILATIYYDTTCSGNSYESEILQMNSCSKAGNAIYYTYSPTLPNFTITDPIVRQTVVDYTGTTVGDTCENGDYVVTSDILFRDMCQFDCHYGDESCLFTTCFNKTANVTYSQNYADGDYTDSCSNVIRAREYIPTTCYQDIVCYKSQSSPIIVEDDDDYRPLKQDDDDDVDLSAGAIAGIVIALLVVLAVMGVIVYVFVQRGKQPPPPLDEKLVL